MRRWRQWDDLDAERTRDVGRWLDVLLAKVATGSELQYDGLSASSLDGQPLALAIGAHLARPACDSFTADASLRSLCCGGPMHAWSRQRARCAPRFRVFGPRLRQSARRWGARRASGAQCSTGCLRVAAHRSLSPADGVGVLTADIRAVGCASASHLGNRRARMRRWRCLVAPETRVAPRPPCQHAQQVLYIRVHQAHTSAPLGRLRGKMFRLHVPARAAFRTWTPVGGQGPRRCCRDRTDFGNSAS